MLCFIKSYLNPTSMLVRKQTLLFESRELTQILHADWLIARQANTEIKRWKKLVIWLKCSLRLIIHANMAKNEVYFNKYYRYAEQIFAREESLLFKPRWA